MPTLTPSRHGPLDDGAPFCIPLPGLFADLEAGQGHLLLTGEFLSALPEVRIRLIQQWIGQFSSYKDAAILEMFYAFARPLADSTIVEQVERFREHCARRGLQCPPDLAILLQRY